MMRIPNDFYIKCDKCNHVSLVETGGLDYETSVYDRPMGEEIEYTFHGEICCEKCHSWIEFCIRGYEYPVGAFNYSDAECHGGEFVDEPTVEIEYEFDDYYYDSAFEEYEKAEAILEYNRNRIKNMSHRGNCHDFYTIQMVKNIRIDKSFLSHSALSVEFGASIHNSAGVEFGKAVMENSSMNIGVYPSEKIGKSSIHSVCKIDDYDLLITDKNVSEDFLSQMDEIGVNYIVAEVEV